jgi:hypothetical protein
MISSCIEKYNLQQFLTRNRLLRGVVGGSNSFQALYILSIVLWQSKLSPIQVPSFQQHDVLLEYVFSL